MSEWRVFYVREYYEGIYKRRQVSCLGTYSSYTEAYLRLLETYIHITDNETDSVYMSRIVD